MSLIQEKKKTHSVTEFLSFHWLRRVRATTVPLTQPTVLYYSTSECVHSDIPLTTCSTLTIQHVNNIVFSQQCIFIFKQAQLVPSPDVAGQSLGIIQLQEVDPTCNITSDQQTVRAVNKV